MTEALTTAIVIMLVGMLTVFFILACVVFTGRIVIWFSNTYVTPSVASTGNSAVSRSSSVPKQKVAVIAAAIQIVSRGKGRVANIQKVESERNHG